MLKELKQQDRIKSIFVYFGEGRIDELKGEIGELDYSLITDGEFSLAKSMFEGTKMTIGNYNNSTGIIKLNLNPSVPLWVLEDFKGYFIPVKE